MATQQSILHPDDHQPAPARDKATVAVVIQYVAPYMATLFRELTKALDQRGIHLVVIAGSTHHRGRAFGDPASWLHGFHYESPELPHFPHPSPSRQILIPNWKLIRMLRSTNAGLLWVHERNALAIISTLWAGKNGLIKVISSDVGANPPAYATTPLHKPYREWVNGLFDGFISMTKEAHISEDPKQRPRILVPHAVSTTEFQPCVRPPGRTKTRFLFVGTLDTRKGFDTLMEAAALLWNERNDFEVRVVGNGPLAEQLTAEGMPWFSIAGHVPAEAIKSEYEQADAFILPSRQDTYAVVAHEAASCGLTLILGSGVGASQILLKEGENGFLVNPDDPRTLVAAMKRFLDNPHKRHAFSESARASAVQYGAESNANRLAAWLDELLISSRNVVQP